MNLMDPAVGISHELYRATAAPCQVPRYVLATCQYLRGLTQQRRKHSGLGNFAHVSRLDNKLHRPLRPALSTR